MGRLRPLAGASLVGAAVACVLVGSVYLTLGTRWGFETYLFPYLLGGALLPLVGALAAGRYELVGPSLVLVAGVAAFVAGVAADLACLQGTANAWGVRYSLGRNVIRWGPKAGGSFACSTRPNRPAVVLGYGLASLGAGRLLERATARPWLPVDRRDGG